MKKILAAMFFVVAPLAAAAEEPKEDEQAAVEVDKRPPAEQRADQLDKLFAALQSEDAKDMAKSNEERIWSLWMKSDSPTADLLLQQGTAAMAEDEFDASEDVLNFLIGKSGSYAEAYYRRAALYFRMHSYDKSLADIGKVLELEPRHFGAMVGRGIIQKERGKDAEALASFEEALAINPHLEIISAVVKKMKSERPDI